MQNAQKYFQPAKAGPTKEEVKKEEKLELEVSDNLDVINQELEENK